MCLPSALPVRPIFPPMSLLGGAASPCSRETPPLEGAGALGSSLGRGTAVLVGGKSGGPVAGDRERGDFGWVNSKSTQGKITALF